MIETDAVIKEAGLVRLTDRGPGIYRKGHMGKFYFENAAGKRVVRKSDLDRIRNLVIPPAWKDVWICPKKNGYLQAVGVDAAGRKQYLYHPDWTAKRSNDKYFRLLEFGKKLPKARMAIQKDLKRKNLDERKVLAICVEIMQKTLIRIGNKNYKETYGTFGLTTLRDRHLKVKGSELTLDFIGKKGVRQVARYSDKRLARLVKQCQDVPGQELFQYFVGKDTHRSVDSTQINNYIRSITGGDFTAKDFRTWGGTLEAMRQMSKCVRVHENIPSKKAIVEVLNCVAKKLGNTRAVCKASYVYPTLITSFESGQLLPYLQKMKMVGEDTEALENQNEKILMKFLKDCQQGKIKELNLP